MAMVDRRPIRMDGVQDLQWSPSDPILAAVQAEDGELPARVVLVRLPGKEELRQKNLFSVAGEERQQG
jgi:translation initiation factor 3 subunit B